MAKKKSVRRATKKRSKVARKKTAKKAASKSRPAKKSTPRASTSVDGVLNRFKKERALQESQLSTVRKKIDDATVKEIQDLADLAARSNVRIAFYPHAGFTIATIDPALELVEKVDRSNVGVMFNLCHFLKSEKESDLEATLDRAGSKLFAVSFGKLSSRLPRSPFGSMAITGT